MAAVVKSGKISSDGARRTDRGAELCGAVPRDRQISGAIVASVGLLTTAPLGVALYHSEQPASDRYLIVVARPLLAGAFMARIAGAKQVQNNQALVISALTRR